MQLNALMHMTERTNVPRRPGYHESQPPDDDGNHPKEMNHQGEEAPD